MTDDEKPDKLLKPIEVAEYFHVDSKTITRWAHLGYFEKYNVEVIRTIGGHRRYRKSDIVRLLEELKRHRESL